VAVELRVALDKNEGVVKKHLCPAMIFCTALMSELVENRSSGHLPVNHFSVESFHQPSHHLSPSRTSQSQDFCLALSNFSLILLLNPSSILARRNNFSGLSNHSMLELLE